MRCRFLYRNAVDIGPSRLALLPVPLQVKLFTAVELYCADEYQRYQLAVATKRAARSRIYDAMLASGSDSGLRALRQLSRLRLADDRRQLDHGSINASECSSSEGFLSPSYSSAGVDNAADLALARALAGSVSRLDGLLSSNGAYRPQRSSQRQYGRLASASNPTAAMQSRFRRYSQPQPSAEFVGAGTARASGWRYYESTGSGSSISGEDRYGSAAGGDSARSTIGSGSSDSREGDGFGASYTRAPPPSPSGDYRSASAGSSVAAGSIHLPFTQLQLNAAATRSFAASTVPSAAAPSSSDDGQEEWPTNNNNNAAASAAQATSATSATSAASATDAAPEPASAEEEAEADWREAVARLLDVAVGSAEAYISSLAASARARAEHARSLAAGLTMALPAASASIDGVAGTEIPAANAGHGSASSRLPSAAAQAVAAGSSASAARIDVYRRISAAAASVSAVTAAAAAIARSSAALAGVGSGASGVGGASAANSDAPALYAPLTVGRTGPSRRAAAAGPASATSVAAAGTAQWRAAGLTSPPAYTAADDVTYSSRSAGRLCLSRAHASSLAVRASASLRTHSSHQQPLLPPSPPSTPIWTTSVSSSSDVTLTSRASDSAHNASNGAGAVAGASAHLLAGAGRHSPQLPSCAPSLAPAAAAAAGLVAKADRDVFVGVSAQSVYGSDVSSSEAGSERGCIPTSQQRSSPTSSFAADSPMDSPAVIVPSGGELLRRKYANARDAARKRAVRGQGAGSLLAAADGDDEQMEMQEEGRKGAGAVANRRSLPGCALSSMPSSDGSSEDAGSVGAMESEFSGASFDVRNGTMTACPPAPRTASASAPAAVSFLRPVGGMRVHAPASLSVPAGHASIASNGPPLLLTGESARYSRSTADAVAVMIEVARVEAESHFSSLASGLSSSDEHAPSRLSAGLSDEGIVSEHQQPYRYGGGDRGVSAHLYGDEGSDDHNAVSAAAARRHRGSPAVTSDHGSLARPHLGVPSASAAAATYHEASRSADHSHSVGRANRLYQPIGMRPNTAEARFTVRSLLAQAAAGPTGAGTAAGRFPRSHRMHDGSGDDVTSTRSYRPLLRPTAPASADVSVQGYGSSAEAHRYQPPPARIERARLATAAAAASDVDSDAWSPHQTHRYVMQVNPLFQARAAVVVPAGAASGERRRPHRYSNDHRPASSAAAGGTARGSTFAHAASQTHGSSRIDMAAPAPASRYGGGVSRAGIGDHQRMADRHPLAPPPIDTRLGLRRPVSAASSAATGAGLERAHQQDDSTQLLSRYYQREARLLAAAIDRHAALAGQGRGEVAAAAAHQPHRRQRRRAAQSPGFAATVSDGISGAAASATASLRLRAHMAAGTSASAESSSSERRRNLSAALHRPFSASAAGGSAAAGLNSNSETVGTPSHGSVHSSAHSLSRGTHSHAHNNDASLLTAPASPIPGPLDLSDTSQQPSPLPLQLRPGDAAVGAIPVASLTLAGITTPRLSVDDVRGSLNDGTPSSSPTQQQPLSTAAANSPADGERERDFAAELRELDAAYDEVFSSLRFLHLSDDQLLSAQEDGEVRLSQLAAALAERNAMLDKLEVANRHNVQRLTELAEIAETHADARAVAGTSWAPLRFGVEAHGIFAPEMTPIDDSTSVTVSTQRVYALGSLWNLDLKRYISPDDGQEYVAVYLRRRSLQSQLPLAGGADQAAPAVDPHAFEDTRDLTTMGFSLRLCGAPGATTSNSVAGRSTAGKAFGTGERASLKRF